MPGVATEKGGKIEQLVLDIRKRKGLKPEIPTLDRLFNSLHVEVLRKFRVLTLPRSPASFALRRVLRQALSEGCTLGFSDLLLCLTCLLLASVSCVLVGGWCSQSLCVLQIQRLPARRGSLSLSLSFSLALVLAREGSRRVAERQGAGSARSCLRATPLIGTQHRYAIFKQRTRNGGAISICRLCESRA